MSEAPNSLQEQILALQPQIIAKAMKDEAFRQHLLNNPKQTLEREFGLIVPHGATILIHEETPTTLHLVLPMKRPTGELQELSDEELKEVAGGDAVYGSSNHPHMWSQQDQVNTN
jgi:Nitrile hydratase, alpha chain